MFYIKLSGKFSVVLVSKDALLDIKLSRYKTPLLLLRTWWDEVCQNVHLKISEILFWKKLCKIFRKNSMYSWFIASRFLCFFKYQFALRSKASNIHSINVWIFDWWIKWKKPVNISILEVFDFQKCWPSLKFLQTSKSKCRRPCTPNQYT